MEFAEHARHTGRRRSAWELQGIRTGSWDGDNRDARGLYSADVRAQENFWRQSALKKAVTPGQEIVARTQYLGNLKRQPLLWAQRPVTGDPGDTIVEYRQQW